MSQKILIVEDEVKIASLLQDYLEQSGYECELVDDGAEAMTAVQGFDPDLILLDIMLPNKDGVTICKEIRNQSAIPIIMVTARVEEVDRLIGLELGADDYICKPFSPREVVARVKAVLRRYLITQAVGQTRTIPVQFDDAKLLVTIKGNAVELTAVEYQLFRFLAQSPGRIYSRSHLMVVIYSDNRIVGERTIDSHIKKLRKKISQTFEGEECVHSVYGVGYKFEWNE